MKPKDAAALAARLIVGAVLVYAGMSKASAPAEEFKTVIDGYDLIPRDLSLPMAALLPWAELLAGWALLLGVQARYATAAAGGLVAAFMTALAQALIRGIQLPNCGCFGGATHVAPPLAFLLDSGLAALCWLSWRWGPGPASLDAWAERGR